MIQAEKKKKELSTSQFDSIATEQQRVIEQKEKNHLLYFKYVNTLIGKLEAVTKTYKQDEKTFLASISKVVKETGYLNDKTVKSTTSMVK